MSTSKAISSGSGVAAADELPIEAIDQTGAIGSSSDYAREDHQHPAQGVSANTPQALKVGVDGLHQLDPADLVSADADNALTVGTDALLGVFNVSADRTYEEVNQTAHGFAITEAIYHNGTDWQKAQADAGSTVAVGIVTDVADADNFEVTTHGVATVAGHGLSAGDYYWLSDATAGGLATVAPNTIAQSLLHVRDANTIFVDIGQAIAVGSAGDALVNDQSASNYIEIGDMLIQWGNWANDDGPTTINFPVAFADTGFSLTFGERREASGASNPGNTIGMGYWEVEANRTASSVELDRDNDVDGHNLDWIAIGRKA